MTKKEFVNKLFPMVSEIIQNCSEMTEEAYENFKREWINYVDSLNNPFTSQFHSELLDIIEEYRNREKPPKEAAI